MNVVLGARREGQKGGFVGVYYVEVVVNIAAAPLANTKGRNIGVESQHYYSKWSVVSAEISGSISRIPG